MGIIADFFVASEDDALAYESSYVSNRAAHIQRYQPAEFRNLTGVELGVLWAHLTAEEWSVEKHMLREVHFADSGETWLLQIPDELVEMLADLKETDFGVLAEWWSTSEDIEPRETEDVYKLLRALSELASKAKSVGKGLFLWGSL